MWVSTYYRKLIGITRKVLLPSVDSQKIAILNGILMERSNFKRHFLDFTSKWHILHTNIMFLKASADIKISDFFRQMDDEAGDHEMDL